MPKPGRHPNTSHHLFRSTDYTRSKPQAEKRQPLRLELPVHLERRDEIIEPVDVPEGAKKIGEAITEVIDYEPASAYVRRIIRPKYIVDQNDEQTNIVIAPLPSLPIPKGNAGPGMLSHILVSKFVDHLPFYRQVQIFKRQNLEIAESTIGGWFNATCNLLAPLYDALKSQVIAADYLMADETPIPVLTKDKPGATHKGYHWVYYDPVHRLVLFDYRKSRGREGPDELLKDFCGYLQTDGYTAYEHLEKHKNITLLACMAHARRKFEHAQENNPTLAGVALGMFRELYDIEERARVTKLPAEELKSLRYMEAKPVLDKLESWLKEQVVKTLPKSAIGGAIAYTLNLWPRLERYIEDGRFHIDNNLIENSIRPVALGYVKLSITWVGRTTCLQDRTKLLNMQQSYTRSWAPVKSMGWNRSPICQKSWPQYQTTRPINCTHFCPGKINNPENHTQDARGRRLTGNVTMGNL